MLFFELYRQLDIRMFQTMSAMDPTYGACAKYVFDRDSLILLGTDHSVRLDILVPKVSTDRPLREWDIESEAMLWFAEDSVESLVVRLVCDAYRIWMQLDANITEEYFFNELNTVNSYLQSYDLRIYIDQTGMSVFSDGAPLTFEQALEIIMEEDASRMNDDGIENLITEAFYYRSVDKYEEAAILLEKAIRFIEPSSEMYTHTLFSLAETYYFMGNYDRAILLYYRVNMKYIADEDDYYLHLGHALLDSKMRKYDRNLRIYYHSKIDPNFADTHRQAVAAARSIVAEVIGEYEETCLDMGRKKFKEYRDSLPEEADDIDELLNIYEKPEEKPVGNKQITGIKLNVPDESVANTDLSVEELLSVAFDKFYNGDYQDAFTVYYILSGMILPDPKQYTWVHFQLAKLYSMFDDPEKAVDELELCDPNNLYKDGSFDDYMILYRHAYIVRDKLEGDARYGLLLRGRLDPYYANHDRNYKLMCKDKRLMKLYRQYEKECMEDARDILGDILTEETKRQGNVLSKLKAFIYGGSDE